MLNLDELDSVYDPSATTEGPGPKVKSSVKTTKPININQVDNPNPSSINIGVAKPVDVRHYGEQLDNGVYSDQDIDSQMGQHQGTLAKIGHAIGNMPGNIVGGMLEGIGDLGLLAGQWGDDRDYHNALIDAGKQLHDLTGEIYMSNPHNTIGQTLSDPGWWISQTEGLAEMGVSYAALGAGVAGGLSKLANGATQLLRAGELGARTAQAFGQLGSAGYMAYTMGASNAADVFKSTYDYQLRKYLDAGQDPDTAANNAKHIAAQSAATTSQLTTGIGTVLGFGAMAPFFRKSENTVMDLMRKEVPMQPGEETEAWLSRVKSMRPEDYKQALDPSHSLSSKLAEMGKMGLEMQQLDFSRKTGEDLGKKGKTKGLLDQFDELSNYVDRAMDKDGWLSFATGVGAGLLIHKLTNDVIPSRLSDKINATTGEPMPKLNQDGNQVGTEKTLYTPKALSDRQTTLQFNSIRDAIASDIEQYGKSQKSYLAAVKAGDPVAVDRATSEMFNINSVNGIINGTGKMWSDTYQGIANLSPEDAQAKGLSDDYKARAEQAVSNMSRYQTMYDDLQKRYGTLYDIYQGYKQVVDGLFARKVHLDSMDQIIKQHEQALFNRTNAENARLPISDPELFDQFSASYARDWESARLTTDRLSKDHTAISKLVDQYNDTDPSQRNNIAQKLSAYAREYSSLDPEANNSTESLGKSLHKTLSQIQDSIDRQTQKVKDAEDKLFNSTGYNQWLDKNPGKSFNEYRSKVHEQVHNTELQHQIELAREKHKIAEQNIAQIEKEKNLVRFANKYNKYLEDEYKKSTEMEKVSNEELGNRAKSAKIMSEAQIAKANEMADRYKSIRDEHVKVLEEEHKRLNDLRDRNKEADTLGQFEKKLAIGPKIREAEKNIAALTAKVRKYDSLYAEHHLQVPDKPPVDTNAITINPPQPEAFDEPETISPESLTAIDTVETIPDQIDLADHEANQAVSALEERMLPLKEAEEALMDHLTTHTDLISSLDLVNDVYKSIQDGNFSYDMLNPLIAEGKLTQTEAAQLLQAMKDYVDAVQNKDNAEDLIGYRQTVTEVSDHPSPGVDTIDTDPPSDTPINNVSNDSNNGDAPAYQIPEYNDQISYNGAKTVDANTIANSTLGFAELKPNAEGEVRNTSVPGALNQKVNPDLFNPKKLTPGTSIRFEVDVDYDGPRHVTEDKENQNVRETFADYSDKNGKVPADKMANVPIKIIDDKTGKVIGYVRKHEWVTEKGVVNGKKQGLKNIAEKYDDDGNEINGATQSRRILDTRQQIVDQFNANGKPVRGSISNKGIGHAILNTEGFKPKPGYAFSRQGDGGLLPDPKLSIVIANGRSLYSGKGYLFDKPVAGDTKDLPNGTIYAALPGANGTHILAPLVGKSLGETDVAHRTISRAIELYMNYNGSEEDSHTHEVNQLHDAVGHDVSTEKGLRDFINQYYTHTQSFDDTATLNQGKGQSKFLFNVWNKIPGKEGKAWIKAGWSESNAKPMYASLDANGKLSSEFSQLLKEGLNSRSKAVVFTRDSLRGINEPVKKDRPFKDAIYNSKGVWQHPEYSNYNEYVKSFSKTTVYGRNKLGSDYVYVANPAISYRLEAPPMDRPTNLVEENRTMKPKIETEVSTYNKHLADEMDSIFGVEPYSTNHVPSIGESENAKELNLKNLEELYTFTPEDQRNGKTPADILTDLTGRGHTFLPDGYNPFSLCL